MRQHDPSLPLKFFQRCARDRRCVCKTPQLPRGRNAQLIARALVGKLRTQPRGGFIHAGPILDGLSGKGLFEREPERGAEAPGRLVADARGLVEAAQHARGVGADFVAEFM